MNPKIHRKKVREADPLICPTCKREMRIISLIDERDVIDLPAMLRLLAQASIALHAGKMTVCLHSAEKCPAPAFRLDFHPSFFQNLPMFAPRINPEAASRAKCANSDFQSIMK